jgi:hypothetical protein
MRYLPEFSVLGLKNYRAVCHHTMKLTAAYLKNRAYCLLADIPSRGARLMRFRFTRSQH